MPTLYLCIQSTYEQVELGIWRDDQQCAFTTIPKHDASKLLITTLNDLLTKTDLSLTALDFIGVSRGPAPFTTLRTVLATVNGLSFATQLPLIGVDALACYLYTHAHDQPTIALWYAFGSDLYVQAYNVPAIGTDAHCMKLEQLITLVNSINYPVRLIGNGLQYHYDALAAHVGTNVRLDLNTPFYSDLTAIARDAYTLWQKEQRPIFHIEPIYLKPELTVNRP